MITKWDWTDSKGASQWRVMLVIFDVDGTLLSNEGVDWPSMNGALSVACGFWPSQAFWDSLEEVTARSAVHKMLEARPLDERNRLEVVVEREYLRRLQEAYLSQPEGFTAARGAADLLKRLRAVPGLSVAIATGDWHSTISFKLQAAGLDVDGIPMATSSDHASRAEIISLAAARSGRPLTDAVYVGDGVWDYRASVKLGIPFIGTGSRIDQLNRAGSRHTLPDLMPDSFESVLFSVRALMPLLQSL